MIQLLGAYQYRPFLSPLPIWDHWAWLIIPLALGVSIVYKAIRCTSMSKVPQEAFEIAFYIILSMILAAVILTGITRLMS
jgi:hypothetical protein